MLHVNGLTYRIGPRVLFDNATVALPPDARVGFLGRNGTGKTTLFRMIMNEASPDLGTVSVPRGARIGRVAQEAPGGPESLIEVVLAADEERTALLAEAETASDPHRIAEIQTRLVDKGAHAAPARAAAILAGLGFDHQAQQRACSEFSGGWRMRVALAALLFTEPDLLLLDEPTNYLDLEGTLWLQDYLASYPHTVVVISHDRDLLNASVDFIMHLTEGRLELYRGGYDEFERQRREKQALSLKLRKKQEDQRRHIQAFIDRFKAKASKAVQAQSRMKMLARMEPVSAIVDNEVVPFNFPAAAKPLSPPIITMEGASAGYGERTVLSKLDLSIDNEDRIGLLGANGNGKSTFAKLIAGRLEAMSGRTRRSTNLKVAYFAQHQLDELNPKATARTHVAELMKGATEAQIRARAAQMGFSGDKADTPVENISGGEKARLLMGLATFGGPHLLILDEPTNHLDIDSREALVQALNDFPGAVILISHDRYLLDACVDRLWLVADGSVKPFEGDMEDYRRLVLSSPASDKDKGGDKAGRSADKRKTAAERRAATAPSRDRIRQIEAAMEKLQAIIADLDEKLSKPGLFERAPDKAAEMAKARATAGERLALAEEAWLEASAALEAAET
ncbi:ABC-F family ATP-binding cassette domain-containing protein [Labrys wisconsinensis]|uniref:ATP-binding cassette subfamily F protein 3 n=1 Tax=Labrys wisconsinensis TaxID=425677 RepID=A0ABU0JFD6_9HYPH|nr:ABC-F family ATP-binding cassette domain-containing protein [Labrys wisconsinensis]MDQ0472991.1 ATP-binding cassette subfamily F protein 3 [Labrys wisconsinensis]